MLPDRVSNPGPLTYESGASQVLYPLRYAARPCQCDTDRVVVMSCLDYVKQCQCEHCYSDASFQVYT